MFDRVVLIVKAGDGSDGAVSFRREKFVPFGGPDGGDGGNGGDVVIVADSDINTLYAYRRRRLFKAKDGGRGLGKKKHGKNGESLALAVPVGTMVWQKADTEQDTLLADLEGNGQRVVVVRGGKGGRGNLQFVSPTNQAPRIAEKGQPGEERTIILELRLIADVGIIGYPNVGKSSLLAAASAAKPRIADYPFTTLEPVLGVVEVRVHSFVLAEIPGLIEGAHLGKGLGHEFLRHAMRTRVLIHLIDGSSPAPVENFVQVNTELGLFDPALAQKPQLVAVNKVDLPEVKSRVAGIKSAFASVGVSPLFISAATREGLPELMTQTWKVLQSVPTAESTGGETPKKVIRPKPVA